MGPPPTIAAYDIVWCGARKGGRRTSEVTGPAPATDATTVAASAASSSRSGSNVGTVRARSVLPDPGGPTSRSACPPARAISSARRASSCPRTSARSGTTVGGVTDAVARVVSAPPPSSTRDGAEERGRERGVRRASTAAARSGTPISCSDAASRASARPSSGTTIRRTPRRTSAATIGSSPGTVRTSPPRDSSPTSAQRPPPARTCSEPRRMPIAIARSSEAPALRTSAGARLTVIRRGGCTNPALRSAPRTRSRASDSAASGRPTMVMPGSPGATSTSTRTTRPTRPWSVAESSVASTPRPYGRALTADSTGA